MEQEKREKRQRKRSDRRSRQKRKAKQSQSESPKAKKHSLLPIVRVGTHRSSLPLEPVKQVVEPKEECAICHQRIDVIASALTHPSGGYAHFDCVLGQLESERTLAEGQKISYIGRGTFAVVQSDPDGSFSFTEQIVWEDPKAFDAMKKYVETIKQ
ncbi:MAG: hypothetical protein GX938_01005 [Spirochaetales bacterium]|jgi:hypothetical protein|nr:hypothetical protein [Spirochaetales bacterium]